MPKNGKFALNMQVWSDSSPSSNDPAQRDFSWIEQLSGLTLAAVAAATYTIPANSTMAIDVPTSPSRFIFVKANQEVGVRFNGDVNDFSRVKPTTLGQTSDGVLFQKIDITSLTLANLSATDPATVLVFLGG